MNSQIITIPDGYHATGTTVELRNSPGVLKRFDATPPGVVCAHFWRLSLGIGCSIGCQYCYLQGQVARGFREPDAPPVLFMDHDGMKKTVQRFLRKSKAQVLNTGELTDSLLFDDYTGILSWMIPMFGEQEVHKLLCLSKVANVRHLYDLPHNGQTIMSWSIQGPAALDRGYEGLAPHSRIRLEAARKCQDAGYPIRLRLDPLIPTPDWKSSYRKLIGWVYDSGVTPERWTLGSLRFFPSARTRAGEDLQEMVRRQGDPDRRYRLDMSQRVGMYQDVINIIRAWFPEPVVGLCKETNGVWAALTGMYSNRVLSDCCNCTF